MRTVLDGKHMSSVIREELKIEVIKILNDLKGRAPHCAVVLVGNDPASATYVKNKENAFKKIGMMSTTYRLNEDATQEEVNEVVKHLNNDDEIDGILVQLPLPKHLDSTQVIRLINPNKDVDGLTPQNQGLLMVEEGIKPCTPLGVVELLKRYDIEISGKNVVVIGRSDLVGRPVALLMLKENATITICHSRTKDLKKVTQEADILIVAMGRPEFIDDSYVKDGAVIVDVGIHREHNEIVGDVNPVAFEKSFAYTPVPGGVGPMTITMLLHNTLKAYLRRNHGA